MLTIQHLKQDDIYLAIPVVNGREDPENEYVFATEEELVQFCRNYFDNRYAALFAYHFCQLQAAQG